MYLLQLRGQAHEIWDVTDPSAPSRITVVVSAARHAQEVEGYGDAYSWARRPRARRMTMIYDLSDPAKPVFIHT
jgi:hypothetical protein